jgi:hypothetical protein
MTWIGEAIRDATLREVYQLVAEAAEWSDWLPFDTAIGNAPRLPGVYLFRERDTQIIRYAGMAGERAGGGRPQGLFGRLSVYRTGKGAVSGFGEAALDRALADSDWVQEQLDDLRLHGPRRAKLWAADAVGRIAPEVSWASTYERIDAKILEDQVVLLLRPHGLWNR